MYAALELIESFNFNGYWENTRIFIDLSKTFDTSDQTVLIQKLNHYGIADASLTLLQNYFAFRMVFHTL